MQNITQVRVTNRNKFDIEDMYDGIAYNMKSNTPISMPYEAACHIFGADFSQGDSAREQAFKHVQRRWGWNRTDRLKQARDHFDRIEFEVTKMVMVEQKMEEALPEPVEHEVARGKKKEVA
jgi:hypothetical protein